jgi:hypothetical protein
MQDLGILNYPANLGHSETLGVNDAGFATGYAYAPLWGPDHGYLYNGQTTLDITPAGQFTFARGVSISNQNVVAWHPDSAGRRDEWLRGGHVHAAGRLGRTRRAA